MVPRLGLIAILAVALALMSADAAGRRKEGVPPKDRWTCPPSHPIKGNFTTYSGEPCIYHVPGGALYTKTQPERCYASEEKARKDGCRRSKR